MSKLNTLIEKGINRNLNHLRRCPLHNDLVLEKNGLFNIVFVIDEYCKEFAGGCSASRCPVHPMMGTILCLD